MSTTAVQSPAAVWTLDRAHSTVEFAIRHLMISTVRGHFTDVRGTVLFEDAAPAQALVDVTIDAQSIDTREPQRDAHLRSPDFFDADRYPALTFRSTAVTPVSPDRFQVVGQLTIRDVAREVVLDVTANGRVRDPWGGERMGFHATAAFRRSDFGLTWNQLLETGGVVVGDEVTISIDVELVRQTPEA